MKYWKWTSIFSVNELVCFGSMVCGRASVWRHTYCTSRLGCIRVGSFNMQYPILTGGQLLRSKRKGSGAAPREHIHKEAWKALFSYDQIITCFYIWLTAYFSSNWKSLDIFMVILIFPVIWYIIGGMIRSSQCIIIGIYLRIDQSVPDLLKLGLKS